MITIQPANRLEVSLVGLTERSVTLNSPTDSLAVSLTPFMRGEDAIWVTLTQAEYDALPVKNPETLYLIVD